MADNTTLPGTGDTIAAEEIGGVKYQQMKLIDPTPGSTVPIGTEANPMAVETVPSPGSFLQYLAQRALAKLTYTLTGLRVDCGGSSVVVGSGTVTTVTTVASMTSLAGIGFNNQNGQSIQQSQLAVQCGFRRNIT